MVPKAKLKLEFMEAEQHLIFFIESVVINKRLSLQAQHHKKKNNNNTHIHKQTKPHIQQQ